MYDGLSPKNKLTIGLKEKSNNVSLDSLIKTATALQKIIKMSHKEFVYSQSRTGKIELYVSEFKNGSVSFDIIAELSKSTDIQIALAGLAFSPKEVFEVTKNAIKFWKYFSKIIKSGKTPTVNIDNNFGQVYIIVNNESEIKLDSRSFDVALGMQKQGKNLTAPLKNNELEYIKIDEDSELHLTKNDADCFDAETELDPEQIDFNVNIISFNKLNKSGQLAILAENKSTKKNFTVISDKLSTKVIESMKKQTCSITAMCEFIRSPDNSKITTNLQIVSVK